MIISSKREQYDGSWRLVLYDTDRDGKCNPKYTKTEFDEIIGSYYEQREMELTRLQRELYAGHISPVYFFLKYYHMDIKDLASRMKLRKSVVKKHLTPKGFDTIKVEQLRRYARIFDIAVSDFFQFTHVPENVSVEVEKYQGRLIQNVSIAVKS
jgi:hypothetical protein